MSGQKGKVHLGPNVSSSAHGRGCVVNGSGAMAAIRVLLLLLLFIGQKQGYLKKKKLQTESDIFNSRWFVLKDGVLTYYKDRNVCGSNHNYH